jgi:hypothetical protein
MKSQGPRVVSFVLALMAAAVILSIAVSPTALKDATALFGF